jgi:thioredoxin-like negative regulator of GroEL
MMQALAAAQQLPPALADYEPALQHALENCDVRLALGKLLAWLRQADAAAEHFEFLRERRAGDEDALLGLALCRLEQGRASDALTLLDALPTNADAALVKHSK